MFLSIATTHHPATDLGYLLHKHPGRMHEFALAFGRAVVAFPQADEVRCEAALALDIDPVALVRDRRATSLSQYVNDRPYAASSFLSVAIAKTYRTALNGRSQQRQALAETAIPLTATLAPIPLRGEGAEVRALFEPLGWRVTLEPGAGAGFCALHLCGTARLADLLQHLYVLIPTLDRDKHYWIGPDEVDKLVAKGGEWLAEHPEREAIARAYLKKRRAYVNEALRQLDALSEADGDGIADQVAEDDEDAAKPKSVEAAVETRMGLNERRHLAVVAAVNALGAARVADVGCSEGRLSERLAKERGVREVLALDVSSVALERAERRVRRLPEAMQQKVTLAQSALGYRDRRLDGIDAACLIEVVEHLDPERLALASDALFVSRPRAIIVTTPNIEHNAVFDMPEGTLRHPDHRFEWSRREFAAWTDGLAERHGYTVERHPVGDPDPEHGPPTQMAVFRAGGAVAPDATEEATRDG